LQKSKYAVENNILLLEETKTEELSGNAVVEGELPALPTLENSDLSHFGKFSLLVKQK